MAGAFMSFEFKAENDSEGPNAHWESETRVRQWMVFMRKLHFHAY